MLRKYFDRNQTRQNWRFRFAVSKSCEQYVVLVNKLLRFFLFYTTKQNFEVAWNLKKLHLHIFVVIIILWWFFQLKLITDLTEEKTSLTLLVFLMQNLRLANSVLGNRNRSNRGQKPSKQRNTSNVFRFKIQLNLGQLSDLKDVVIMNSHSLIIMLKRFRYLKYSKLIVRSELSSLWHFVLNLIKEYWFLGVVSNEKCGILIWY